jgi:hypothetical protein
LGLRKVVATGGGILLTTSVTGVPFG